MNLFSLGLVGERQLFTHHLVRFSSNAIQVTGGELPWLIWGGATLTYHFRVLSLHFLIFQIPAALGVEIACL